MILDAHFFQAIALLFSGVGLIISGTAYALTGQRWQGTLMAVSVVCLLAVLAKVILVGRR